MPTIFERLRRQREELGLSQQALAGVCGITARSQRNYESGERLPDAAYLAALSSAGADVLYILTGTRSQPVGADATLPPDERVLLNNYRACNDKARQNLIQTSALLSAGMAVPTSSASPKRPPAKATGGVTQTVSGRVGGSVVAGNYNEK